MGNLTLSTKIKKGPNIITKKMADELIILDPLSGEIRKLNGTAAFIWQSIKSQTTIREIIRFVCRRFEVKPQVAHRDILKFLKSYLKNGLIRIVK